MKHTGFCIRCLAHCPVYPFTFFPLIQILAQRSMSTSDAFSSILLNVFEGRIRRQIQLECAPDSRVGAIKAQLGARLGGEPEQMRIIFCGRTLDDRSRIDSFSIGPQTALTVTIDLPSLPSSDEIDSTLKQNEIVEPEERETGSDDEESNGEWVKVVNDEIEGKTEDGVKEINLNPSDGEFSTFHVFCKKCDKLERAKLRAYCRECASSAVIFKQEPVNWADVANGNSLRVDCRDCDGERAVKFRFKCIQCCEVAAPLQHVFRRNSFVNNCTICGESATDRSLGIRLPGCGHSTCVQCFCAYSEQQLAQMSLVWQPQVGYTINCPVYGCSAFVSDVHTFYLLGAPTYRKYQQMAAQMYFASQVTERQHCPWTGCEAAFFVEEAEMLNREKEKVLLCPECSRMFCRLCGSTRKEVVGCKCGDNFVGDENVTLIQRITKRCPNCAVPTERAGGCAHIHCTQCQTQWCFICVQPWSDKCQWDHWFE